MKQKLYEYLSILAVGVPPAATFYFTLTYILKYSFEYRIPFDKALGYSTIPSLFVLVLMVKILNFFDKKFGK